MFEKTRKSLGESIGQVLVHVGVVGRFRRGANDRGMAYA